MTLEGEGKNILGTFVRAAQLCCLAALSVCAFGQSGVTQRSSVPPNGICTNYDGSGFAPGAVVPDPRDFVPEPDLFPAMITDSFKPSMSELATFTLDCYANGFDIDIYNYYLDQVIDNGLNPAVQMVCNFVPEHGEPPYITIGQSSFNLIFPPFFDRGSSLSYPIMITANGWGVTNNECFRSSPGNPTMVKRMFGVDQHGMVLINWNCGGLGSLGLTEKMQKDVIAVIDLLAAEFNCDRHRIAIRGGSRAGGAALQLARNRFGFDYTVVGLFIRNPALNLGTLSQTPVASCPALCLAYQCLLGDQAYRYNIETPPLADPAPILWPILETNDPGFADFWSADGGSLEGLSGKFILLSTGSHDIFFRLDAFIGLTRKLSFAGIPHSVIIKLQSGHGPGKARAFDTIVDDFLERMIEDGPRFDPASFHPGIIGMGCGERAMNYFCRETLDNTTDPAVYQIHQNEMPFVATFPWRLGRDVRDPGIMHEPGAVFLCGAAGRLWRVVLLQGEGPGAEPVGEWSGRFRVPTPANPCAETAVIHWGYEGLPGMDSTDCYTWRFYYDGNDVSGFTNYWQDGKPIAARTGIQEHQPWIDEYRLVPGCGFSPGIDVPGSTLPLSGISSGPVTTHFLVELD